MCQTPWTDELLPAVAAANAHSSSKLVEIGKQLSKVDDPRFSIIVVGSYARMEANSRSDFDYFLYSPKKSTRKAESLHKNIAEIICGCGISPPSAGGPFGDGYCCLSDFTTKIGGDHETNKSLTRRLLLLLESKWLTGERHYDQLLAKVLTRYIGRLTAETSVARFFLNDLIKYYRTVCVDFEYKTVEVGKDWGIRNIKLAFSRKLIYFSGLLVAAETAQREALEKRRIVKSLLALPPIERIQSIAGDRSLPALKCYDRFLEAMADDDFRKMLSRVTDKKKTQAPEFRELKNEAQHFTWALSQCVRDCYAPSHPIHLAIEY